MKIYAKLFVIALMIAMIFAVGSVSAVENGTADASDLTLVPHERVVSVPDSTVQEVETIKTETSEVQEKAQTNEITSSSDNLNSTDSNKESLRESKNRGPVLGASSNQEILAAKTIHVQGNTFSDIQAAFDSADPGDIIDLGGKIYYQDEAFNRFDIFI